MIKISVFMRRFKPDSYELSVFSDCVSRLMSETELSRLDSYIQHGNTTCLTHSVAVAYYSLVLSKFLRIKCDTKSLVTGALLHDYFLYDWHRKGAGNTPPLHGFFHPGIAYKNASAHYGVNNVEADIIKKHMFPLTPLPPFYKESLIVCLADKWCSLWEIFRGGNYHKSVFALIP